MKSVIIIPPSIYAQIQTHLLPKGHVNEEAAFVFAKVKLSEISLELNFIDWYLVQPDDYVTRSAYHFELKQEVNGRVIKQAHDLDACIIEFHSHIDQDYTEFSPTDWMGFSEFVPHVLWRLKGKPYVAVVVTVQGFDALVWQDDIKNPHALYAIEIDGTEMIPSNISLKRERHEW